MDELFDAELTDAAVPVGVNPDQLDEHQGGNGGGDADDIVQELQTAQGRPLNMDQNALALFLQSLLPWNAVPRREEERQPPADEAGD